MHNPRQRKRRHNTTWHNINTVYTYALMSVPLMSENGLVTSIVTVFMLFWPNIRQGRVTSWGLDREIATNQTLCIALDLTAHVDRLFHVISVFAVTAAQRLEPNMIGTTWDLSVYLGWQYMGRKRRNACSRRAESKPELSPKRTA